MNAQISRQGNNLAILIPDVYAKKLRLRHGTDLELTRVRGGLLLQPRNADYTLDDLLRQIKPENCPDATESGEAVGREVW